MPVHKEQGMLVEQPGGTYSYAPPNANHTAAAAAEAGAATPAAYPAQYSQYTAPDSMTAMPASADPPPATGYPAHRSNDRF